MTECVDFFSKVSEIVSDYKFDRITAEEGQRRMKETLEYAKECDTPPGIVSLIECVYEMFSMISNEVAEA